MRGGEVVRSRSTTVACPAEVSGRDASESLMGLNFGGVGGSGACGQTVATGFTFDPRETSLCRGVLSGNILIRVNGVF